MLDVVAFMNGKGGVGKSALARTYAVTRAKVKSDKVILADMNEGQYTAALWSETRTGNGFKPEVDTRKMTVREVHEMMTSTVIRPDVLVLDTPGWKDETSFKIAGWSTYVVIPCGSSMGDDVVPTMQFALQLLQRGFKPWRFGIALTKFRTETFEADASAVRKAIASDENTDITIFPGVIRNMKSYSDALSVGQGLTETSVGSLNEEAAKLMGFITSRVKVAQKEFEKLAGREIDHDRAKGRGRA
jgi:cellulose biosynthesis protein BcsQ